MQDARENHAETHTAKVFVLTGLKSHIPTFPVLRASLWRQHTFSACGAL